MKKHKIATQDNEQSRYKLSQVRADIIRTSPPINMTVLEGAAYIGVSPRKLRELISSGRVKSARVGTKIIIRREYLDEILKVA